MTRIYLATGSNLANRLANLRAVEARLAPDVHILRASPVYETAPWGYAEQRPFLNQVLEAETSLAPMELFALVKRAEQEIGREPSFRNGPRIIDIDILFYGEGTLDLPDLQIPHPRMRGRAFALRPLADLNPSLMHPSLGLTAQQLSEETDPSLAWRHKGLDFTRKTYIMGILNVTPDSFSGDGLLQREDPVEAALAQAREFLEAGADILDIGGESTRPGSQIVSSEEELARVLPVIRALAGETEAILSVDTYKADVAREALCAGADWVNDVWGLRADAQMGAVAARAGATTVLMHNRSKASHVSIHTQYGGRYEGIEYADLLGEVKAELMQSVDLALAVGVLRDSLILDPGIGFGKTVEQNLELIDRLDEIRGLGWPVLLGASRKSFIGYTLNLPPGERLEGTAAAAVVGILRGANILRVHDVRFMARAARMTDAITRRRPA